MTTFNDEGRPASRPHVNADPTSPKSPVPSKHDTASLPSNTPNGGVPQHIALPEDLTGRWASSVVLSPPGRAVVLDGLDCGSWSAQAVHTLTSRLSGRSVELVAVPAGLAFWLTADLQAVGGCAA